LSQTSGRSRQHILTASSRAFPISRSLRRNLFFSVIFFFLALGGLCLNKFLHSALQLRKKMHFIIFIVGSVVSVKEKKESGLTRINA
jgi:hypothetical protein